jgi:hypothetical protein
MQNGIERIGVQARRCVDGGVIDTGVVADIDRVKISC